MKVLVVGGAGYIGSHCVRQLQLAGHQPIVLDNLVLVIDRQYPTMCRLMHDLNSNSSVVGEVLSRSRLSW